MANTSKQSIFKKAAKQWVRVIVKNPLEEYYCAKVGLNKFIDRDTKMSVLLVLACCDKYLSIAID